MQILACCDYFPHWKYIKSLLNTEEKEGTIQYHGNSIASHSKSIFYVSKSFSYKQNSSTDSCILKKIHELEQETKKLKAEITGKEIRNSILEKDNNIFKQNITKLTETIDELNKKIQSLKIENLNLQNSISQLKKNNMALQNEIKKMEEQENTDLTDKSLVYKTCYKLWKQAKNNEGKTTNRSYDEALKPIFVLFVLLGKKVYALAYQTLGFPSYQTAVNYKKEESKKYFGDTFENKTIFNGTLDNIKTLVECFMPNDKEERDENAVLVVDAASIRANITIEENGVVEGLIKPLTISKEEATELILDEDKFRKFCYDKLDEAAQAIFVILVAPIDPSLNTFPICEITANSGAATDEITNTMDKLKLYLKSTGVNIIGYGNDGDKHYLTAAMEFIKMAMNSFEEDISKPLAYCFDSFTNTIVFYDPLHNGKNNRYFLSDPRFLFFWIDEQATKYHVEELKQIIDPNVLSTSSFTKMDDNLALKLFSEKSIAACIEKERKDLAFALLPTTLLFQAIFKEDMSRHERIRRLSIGFAIVFLYSYDGKLHKEEKQYKQNEYKSEKGSRIWPNTFCGKYLEMIYGTIKELSLNRRINLGSLGSHLIEHWFGLIRKLTHQNFELKAFQDATRNTLLYRATSNEIGVKTSADKRKSDSGVKLLNENEDISLQPFGKDLWIAYKIARECGMPIFESDSHEEVMKPEFNVDLDYNSLDDLFHEVQEQNKSMMSMRKSGIGKVPGAIQSGTHNANSQLNNLVVEAVYPKRRSRSMRGKTFKGMYESKY